MRNFNSALFLLGLFSETQIRLVGSIGISELYMFIVAPFVFIADYSRLKRNGFMAYIFFVILAMLGCVISSLYNSSPLPNFLRGFASAYSLFAMPVVFHRHIMRNMSGFRWYFVGMLMSTLITLFSFQSGVELGEMARTQQAASHSELYFLRHFGALFSVWYQGWYMQLPTMVTCLLISIPTIVTIVTTSTGRSSLGLTALSLIMVLYCRRWTDRMRNLGRHVIALCVITIICSLMMGVIYKYAAENGFLNDSAQAKYDNQSKRGTRVLDFLIAGRTSTFAAIVPIMERPIVGYGSWAIDDGYLMEKWLREYGAADEYESFVKTRLYMQEHGGFSMLIGAHSHLLGFWLEYGILGLPIWIYVIFLFFRHLRRYAGAVPQWFCIIVVGLPNYIWGILFSPFANRHFICFIITLVHISIAVGKGRAMLPTDMFDEARRWDKSR